MQSAFIAWAKWTTQALSQRLESPSGLFVIMLQGKIFKCSWIVVSCAFSEAAFLVGIMPFDVNMSTESSPCLTPSTSYAKQKHSALVFDASNFSLIIFNSLKTIVNSPPLGDDQEFNSRINPNFSEFQQDVLKVCVKAINDRIN